MPVLDVSLASAPPTRSVDAPVAQLHDIRRRFGETVALDGVSLELHAGEVLGLLGPNGAGKTTAVSILLGLRRPDDGRATLFGRSPHDRRARRAVGVVLQEIGFPPTLRVREVIELVRAHHPQPVAAGELLDRFALREVGDRQTGGLSGGQRRRLAVALALAGRPQALVLDEPTAGLDAAARRALWRELHEFVDGGGAVLLTTHQLDEAEHFATRLVVLVNGRVELEGTVADVRARAGLTRVRLRAERLPELPAAQSVETWRDRHVIYTPDADELVSQLLQAGLQLRELEVSPPTLEEAFLVVTGNEQ